MQLLAAAILLASSAASAVEDSLAADYSITPVSVVWSPKQEGLVERSVASTVVFRDAADREDIRDVRSLSSFAPNFHIPEYGSRMTSSIYVRGMGARIDQPAVGLYVDDIPYMNKNAYDFDLLDLRSIQLLRGPQSTLYGRNTMAGVMNVYTLSPLDWTGTRLMAEYGTANAVRARASHYVRVGDETGISLGGYYHRSDGYFENACIGSMADWERGGGGRMKVEWRRGGLHISNTFHAEGINQGGWPYRYIDPGSGVMQPVEFNDPCRYRRLTLGDAVKLAAGRGRLSFTSVTSWAYLDDRMILDQDFTPRSMFTLQQSQQEHTFTEDAVLRYSADRYSGLFGVFGFAKNLRMSAPVRFKKDGIDELILKNANAGLQHAMKGAQLSIDEDEFDIASDFRYPVWGAAFYHTSEVRAGRWLFGAGIRFDYEHAALRYDSHADINYTFTIPMMPMPVRRPLSSRFEGRSTKSFFEVLPRVAVSYEAPSGTNIYLSVSKGYKAGGFNTQIFSDILQNRLMTDMMADLMAGMGGNGKAAPDMGTAAGGEYDAGKATGYRPEHSWNYELGAHIEDIRGLTIDLTAFYIDCRDQQLTVFPSGKGTGRMMTNAGRTRSFGVEATAAWNPVAGLDLRAAYGYTDARFLRYDDGRNDYRNRYVPYAPQHTLSLSGDYAWQLRSRLLDRITLHADWRGVGRIYWNEANTLSQPFYGLLSASVGLHRGAVSLEVWGRNLAGREYDTFYFVSVGNAFMQSGRPRTIGVRVAFEF